MKHIIYFSGRAQTSGNFRTDELMKAGRMDIVIHSIIQSLFLSNSRREDTTVHLVFYGMPDPPKHIEIRLKNDTEISKKDVAGLIKKILYKYKEGDKREVFPGCFVEKKSLLKVVEELDEKDVDVFVLDEKGEDIRKIKIAEKGDVAFVLGDHDGFPQKELKRLKTKYDTVSVGPKTYFASQVITIVQNEMDRRGV